MKFARKRQLNISGRQMLRRGLSGLLAASMILQGAVFTAPLKAEAAGASSASWANQGPVIVNSMNLDMSKRLRALGGGNYELTFTVNGFTTVTYDNEHSGAAQEGYYVVYTSGTYQLDLYGGDGGDGTADESNSVDTCNGGAGGHVHGQIELQEGQVLYYSLGGNGSNTSAAATGGGANGGGNNSGTGNQTGGGGGYSAVYLLSGFTDIENLTLADVQEKLEANPDTYIMIAGGGGGGGDVSWLAQNPAHGGDGGTLNSTNYGAAGGSVPGTWYGGTSGTASSGADDEGAAGGGNITTSWSADRAGGDTVRRGGAAGGGFAGGAGGSSVVLLGTGVEGGGGGSSFVADSINTNVSAIGADTSKTGGSLSVSFLETDHLNDLKTATFSATISEYFNIVSVQSTSGNVSYTGNTVSAGPVDLNEKKETITVTIAANYGDTFGGGNNVPVLARKDAIIDGKEINVSDASVTVGGEVRYFNNTADNLFDHTGDEDDPPDYVTDFVNVPLSYTVQTVSYSNGTHTDKNVKNLYVHPYSSNEYVSSFAYGISFGETDLTPKEGETPAALTQGKYKIALTVTPTDREPAVVGAVVAETTFYGTALVSDRVITSTNQIANPYISVERTLTHDGSQYLLSVGTQIKEMKTLGNIELQEEEYYPKDGAGSYTFTAKTDGWYYIQAWGADGGDSATAVMNDRSGYNSSNAKTYTGKGALGGESNFASGLYYLEADTELSIEVFSKPATYIISDNASDRVGYSMSALSVTVDDSKTLSLRSSGTKTPAHLYTYGTGGQGSVVMLGSTELLAAGGGGGAGGAVAVGARVNVWFSSSHEGKADDGKDAAKATMITSSEDFADGYNGESGKPGSHGGTFDEGFTAAGGNPGKPGRNMIPTAVSQDKATDGNRISVETIQDDKLRTDVTNQMNGEDTKLQHRSDGAGTVKITQVYVAESNFAGQESAVSFSVPISRYFAVNAVTLGEGWTAESSKNEDTGITAVSLTNKETGETASFEYSLAADSDNTVCTVSKLTIPSDTSRTETDIINERSFDLTFSLSPSAGFLGGNDVPLLQEGSQAVITVGETSMTLLEDPAADYANVEITDLSSVALSSTGDQRVLSGTSVTLAGLYAYSSSLDTNSWQAKFVEAVPPDVSPTTTAPTETTLYTITAGLKPTADPEKAVVIGSASAAYKTVTTTVYVDYAVTVNVEHATPVGFVTQVAEGEPVTVYLTADEGYDLPASVSVAGATDYTYDAATGQIDIPADKITGNITIFGAATLITYDLHFVLVADNGDETELTDLCVHGRYHIGDTIDMTAADAYAAEQTNDKEGHTFQWVGLPDDGKMPAGLTIYGGYVPDLYDYTINYKYKDSPMYEDGTEAAPSATGKVYFGVETVVTSPSITGYSPDREEVKIKVETENEAKTVTFDVIYTPNKYPLTIKYVDANGNPVKDKDGNQIVDYYGEVTFGDTYSVKSPAVTGHTADQEVISGTMNTEGKEFTVIYTPIKYTLTINYVYEDPDGNKSAIRDPYVDTKVPYGTEYSIKSPDINGYTPRIILDDNPDTFVDATTVEGIMDSEGKEITVTYVDIPAGLTVIFIDKDSGMVIQEINETGVIAGVITVPLLDSIDSAKYEPRDIDDNLITGPITKEVGEADKVVQVYYHRKPYTLIIKYVYEDGTTAAESEEQSVTYDDSYSVKSPEITGYTPDQAVVSGTMGAEDLEVTVKYARNKHTVTLNYYLYGDKDPIKTETEEFTFGDDQTINIPDQLVVGEELLAGYEPRKNKGDTETWKEIVVETDKDEDLVYDIYYFPKRYTLSIIGVDPFGNPWMKDEHNYLITEVETVEHGVAKPVTLPTLDGYTAVDSNGNPITTYTGTWTTEKPELEITYVKDDVVYYVTVDWGNLVFDYTQRKNWDGATHRYEIPPAEDGKNRVEVTNNALSQKGVQVNVSFSPLGEYPTMTGLFSINSKTGSRVAKVENHALDKGATNTYWLWLYGSLTEAQQAATNQAVGSCTVTISPENQGG